MDKVLKDLANILEQCDYKHYYRELIYSARKLAVTNPESIRVHEVINALNSAIRKYKI